MRSPKERGPDGCASSREASAVTLGRGAGEAQNTLRDKYRQARGELNDKLDVLELLSHWRLELQSRLARKTLIFLYADFDTETDTVEGEVRDFVRVSKVLTWMRRQP